VYIKVIKSDLRAQNTHLLQVQLTEAEKRGIKTLAASQGLTLRQAVQQAFAAWAAQLQSGTPAADLALAVSAAARGKKPGRPKRTATPHPLRSAN